MPKNASLVLFRIFDFGKASFKAANIFKDVSMHNIEQDGVLLGQDDQQWPDLSASNWKEVRLIWYFSQGLRSSLFFCAMSGILAAATNLLTIWGIASVVNGVAQDGFETFFNKKSFYLIFLAALILVIDPILQYLCARQTSKKVSAPSILAVLRQGFTIIQRQDLTFYHENSSGTVVSAVRQTSRAIQRQLTITTELIPKISVLVIGSIFLLSGIAWQLCVPILVWIILIFLATRLTVSGQIDSANKLSKCETSTFADLTDLYINAQTVKSFSNEEYEARRFERTLRGYLLASIHHEDIIAKTDLILNITNAFILVTSFAISAYGMRKGWFGVGDFVAGMMVIRSLGNYSRAFVMFTQMATNTIGTIRASISLFSEKPKIISSNGSFDLRESVVAMELKDVSFYYPTGYKALDSISLKINPGERVGIVGASGAGKTTLINLLLRMHDPSHGVITLNEQDIKRITLTSLRHNIGIVSQDTALFHRSVRENIAYGSPGANDNEIFAAAAKAQAHDFVTGLKDKTGRTGYDAKVGERGVRLSGGQRQRIAIARIMLRNPPFIILDEATSALDSETENVIQQQFGNLSRGKTVVAIAHRLSTILKMDRVVVLDQGKIVEQGEPRQLESESGVFSKLLKYQYLRP